MLSTNLFTYGHPAPPPQPLLLQAGPLSMHLDPETAFLRRLRLGDTEILRGIYAAVRDRNWGTVPPRVEYVQRELGTESFQLSFVVRCEAPGIGFRWRGTLTGNPAGTIEYSLDGEALTTFLRNRIGFCVLHPLEGCAGNQAFFETEKKVGTARFSESIEPQIFGQATFSGLRGFAHEVKPGLWAELRYTGDVFETEDQRNWTDASYKTYCTPLAIPLPVEIRAGTRVSQKVKLQLVTSPLEASPSLARIEVLELRKDESAILTAPGVPTGPLPRLGFTLSDHAFAPTAHELECLQRLKPDHLREDVRLACADWLPRLHRAGQEAAALGSRLEIALHIPAEPTSQMVLFKEALAHLPSLPARLMVFDEGMPVTSAQGIETVRSFLGKVSFAIGGGSNAHFCELNRAQALGQLPLRALDFLSWPITPQVHAFDNKSMVESLEAQPHTVATANSFAQGRPLSVSPVTLRPRFNAVATGPETELGAFPSNYDPRQLSLFAAAWTVGSLAGLFRTGVDSATYYETTGWGGLMQTELPHHHAFPARPGLLYPVYHLFSALAGCCGFASLEGKFSSVPGLTGFCLFEGTRLKKVVLAELTGVARQVQLMLPGEATNIEVLDPRHPSPCGLEGDGGGPGHLSIRLEAHALAFVTLG